MKSAVKILLQVGEREAAVLDSQSRIANWLYNTLLERANALRTQYRASQDKTVGKTLYTERGLRDLIPALKEQHPFLKSVYSSPLKNAALRLSQAIRAYQDGKHGRRAKAMNWPRFRAWKRS
jgi:putative transposase